MSNSFDHELHAGIYQHYKGPLYLVLGLAHHSETQDRFVVYVPLYVREGPRMCVRPADMFFEEVCINPVHQGHVWTSEYINHHADCQWVPRFKFVGYEHNVSGL